MLQLIQLPMLRDNYTYLVHRDGAAIVVDPAQAPPVLRAIESRNLQLAAVVCTHHHMDHVGGNLELQAATGCEIVGPAHDRERIPGCTLDAHAGASLQVGPVTLRVLDVRAHTKGHVAYALDELLDVVIRHGHGGAPTQIDRFRQKPALFVGDALFLGGCGRLFEGTPADLFQAMKTLSLESHEALVCCAHEYTEANLRFAQRELPHIAAIEARLRALASEKAESGSSVPDFLGLERQTNPFLLALQPKVREHLARKYEIPASASETEILGLLRSRKDAG